jgi:hypothetical protein
MREASSLFARLKVSAAQIDAFCWKWKVRELSLFGSTLRGDCGPDSDVDLLAVFDDEARWTLWDLIRMRDELKQLFAREVDLVEKRALRNPFRRREILRSCEVIHAG